MALKNKGLKGKSGAKARKTVGKKATDGLNPDVLADKLADLKKLVPEAFVEGKLDADLLQEMFKKGSVAGVGKEALAGTAEGERYGLSWAGKRYVYEEIAKKSVCTLTKDEKRSLPKNTQNDSPKGHPSENGKNVDADRDDSKVAEGGPSESSGDSDNIFIEGENLEVLRTLQKAYFNKVKMIYIDPPYNTGKDFVYHDNFRQTEEAYCDECNVSENGHLTKALKLNTKDGGRFHSNWLNMIYPRLYLARNLLRDDGVIFVSIDDNEVHNLRMVMNEIFGEENFVATFPWRKRTAKSDVSFGISQDYEWIICFAKQGFLAGQAQERKYHKTDDIKNDRWRLSDLTKQTSADERPNSAFNLKNPKDGKEYPFNPNRTWSITKDTFQEYYDKGKIVFPGDYDFLNISIPAYRVFESEDKEKALKKYGTEEQIKAVSTQLPKDIGMSENGNKDMVDLFDGKIFSFPKPISLVQYFIEIVNDRNEQSLILDFFAGSGTTAHAVMAQNIADGGNRSYICVQMPEETPVGSEARKAGYERISDIAIERVGRASAKLKAENPDYAGDLGLQVYKATNSHFAQWQAKAYDDNESLMQDIIDYANAKPEGTPRERVDEVLLKLGYPLTTPLEDMGNWYMADGKIALLLSEKFKAKDLMSVFDAKPTTVIVLEQIFKKDEQKINFDLRCGEREVIFQTI